MNDAEHLGSQEKYQYTRSTIEGSLQKKSVKENIEFNTQELSDFSENENKFSQRGQKNSRLDVVDLIEDKTVSTSKEVPEDLLIDAALERLEQKLDFLEERIEHLEQLLDKQEKEAKHNVELDSEDDLDVDVWDEDKSDEVAEDLDTQLVNVLLDVSEKYEQINPNSGSGIPIGDSCRLCSDRADNKTVITIEEQDDEGVEEIFKATIESDSGEFVISKDELDKDSNSHYENDYHYLTNLSS